MRVIEASVDIDAPVQEVWRTLSDGDHYADWNPFITVLEGQLQVGASPLLRIAPPGKKARTFRPRIADASPSTGLRWQGRLLLPGLCDATHEFLLSAESRAGTRLVQRETFRGILVPMLGSMLEPTRQGFVNMHEALRRRVESQHDSEEQHVAAP
jgi:hypothetical protein